MTKLVEFHGSLTASMGRLAVVGTSLGVWTACVWYGVPRQARAIEHEVQARCSAALYASGLPAAGLRVDGRDVWLTGTKSSPQTSETTVDLLLAVPGVRNVQLQLAPEPQVVVPERDKVQGSLAAVLAESPVSFAGAALDDGGRKALDRVAAVLNGAPALAVAIEAGAKTPELGRRRALSVRQYLIGRGLVASRLSAKGRAPGSGVQFRLREVQ